MNVVITKIVALFASLLTMLSAIFCPPKTIIPEFPETTEQVKTAFDEGEFVMGENDLIVSPDGDDANPGTVEAPLKTFEKAKEILKASDASDGEAVTVWFREGTYLIKDTVEFVKSSKNQKRLNELAETPANS